MTIEIKPLYGPPNEWRLNVRANKRKNGEEAIAFVRLNESLKRLVEKIENS